MDEHKFVSAASELLSTEDLARLSGLEFMSGILEGNIPAPPICEPMNYRLHNVEKGRVVFRGYPKFAHLNPMGGVHGGWFGTLLDSCMACAFHTMLPAGQAYTTVEYKLNIVRASLPDTQEFDAIGIVDHSGRRIGVANGELRGVSDGKLYATGSTTCLVLPVTAG